MWSRIWIGMGLVSLGLLVNPTTRSVLAGEHSHHKPRSTEPTPHTEEQAGWPHEVSIIAMESYNHRYDGGYVGGGQPHFSRGVGQDPCGPAGTWGWDYTPFNSLSSRIFMNWSHGRRYQGGYGAYRTDGPKPIEYLHEKIKGHFHGEVED